MALSKWIASILFATVIDLVHGSYNSNLQTENKTKTGKDKAFTTIQPMRKYICSDARVSAELDSNYGIKNADAKNVNIKYKPYLETTIAQVTWDLPEECLKPNAKKCLGFFIEWLYDRTDEWYCYKMNGLENRSFTLDENASFDGKKRFAINILAYPYANLKMQFTFKQPPSPDELKISQKVLTPTVARTKNITEGSTVRNKVLTNFNLTNEVGRVRKNKDSTQQGIVLKLSLTLFLIAFFLFGVLMRWIYKKHLWKKYNYNVKVHRSDYENVIKGKHYISYLPEHTTVRTVLGICSWLTSYDIDVVVDKMYDPKLYNSLGPKRFGEIFVKKAEKVIIIITQGYLRLCWLDDAVEINSKPTLDSLNKERLYSEVMYIKSECSTMISHDITRFLVVLVDVRENELPKWLRKVPTVHWPEDGKNDKFLDFLKDSNPVTKKLGQNNHNVNIV